MAFDRLRRRFAGLAAAGLLGLGPQAALAGTTGTVTGKVTGPDQRPIAAAAIVLAGQRLGAYSDAEGGYRIVKVPPGTYEVSVTRLNYETVRVQGVIVSADQTTFLDVAMKTATLEAEEVVVVAKRPPVDLKLTSTQATVTSDDIEALPVQELQDIVNLQAGVVEGHFRGGRLGEVQYQVDGVSVNNPYDNKSTLSVDRSLLQEVQIISGTFDAEYGQAMSGVVNAVLKEGTSELEWGAEVYAGGFYPGNDSRISDDEVRPTGVQNYQASASGPLPVPDTVFLVSGRRYEFDDFVKGRRRFLPTDRSDFEEKVFVPTGNGEELALGYVREWSGVAKLTNTSLPKTKLGYQVLFDLSEGRGTSYRFRLNPDGLAQNTVVAVSHGLDVTQTLGASSFLDLSVRHNYTKFESMRYEDLFDPRYDAAGPPLGDPIYELGAYVQGVDFGRFRARMNGLLLKSSYVNQVTAEHRVKGGFELVAPTVQFGVPGHLVFTTEDGVETLVRHIDEPPDFPGLREYEPHIGAAFLQDQGEWRHLTIRAGLRLDYFDPRAQLPSDLANPAGVIEGAPPSDGLRDASRKVSLSPRLGVAYPIEDYAALHFSYGHFRQFPPIGEMFANADYSVLANLQAGTADFGVLGNPDVNPEETAQYEVGYKHALSEDFGVDVTTFYKDVRDLLGVEFVSTYNNAEYARLTNVDFGDVFGFTVALDHRRFGPASVALDYTWQQAMGNSSDPRETANRAEAGEDPRPRLVPLNWDQRHTFNMTVSLSRPDVYSVSAVLRAASGQPYTPELGSGFGEGLDTNSGRKPNGVLVDLRTERFLGTWQGAKVSLFARSFNLLDTRYFNGAVFASTGDPYYSRNPKADEALLADPTRFYPPRRIEFGLRFGDSDVEEKEGAEP